MAVQLLLQHICPRRPYYHTVFDKLIQHPAGQVQLLAQHGRHFDGQRVLACQMQFYRSAGGEFLSGYHKRWRTGDGSILPEEPHVQSMLRGKVPVIVVIAFQKVRIYVGGTDTGADGQVPCCSTVRTSVDEPYVKMLPLCIHPELSGAYIFSFRAAAFAVSQCGRQFTLDMPYDFLQFSQSFRSVKL